jgi:hypothetical protein
MRIMILFLMAGLITACGRGDAPEANTRGAAGGPSATYARRMVFVGGGEAAPAIVVFEHSALAGPAAVERNAGIWRKLGDDWTPLLDLRWIDLPIREPWRLVPHGPFRIMVNDAGEVEAIRGRGEAGGFLLTRLGHFGEWSQDDPPLYRINHGEWSQGSDTIAGLLVDIHPGASPADAPASPALMELVLTDGAEFHFVASVPAGTPSATAGGIWLQRGERLETMEGVLAIRDTIPGELSWRIEARGGELYGELRPTGAPLALSDDGTTTLRPATNTRQALSTKASGIDGGEGSRPAESVMVRAVAGWIEVRGDRRPVFGIFRRAPM